MKLWHGSFTLGVCLLLIAALVGMPSPATAADLAKVRIGLDTDQLVWVGQRVSVHVDLLSATFFSGTPEFSLPSLPGAVLLKIEARPVLSTEQIDGDTYSVQRHTFAVFLQRPGQIVIPAFQVQFAVAPAFGQPPVAQRLMTTPIMVQATMPPGTEAVSMLISTTDLQVDDIWAPVLGDDGTATATVGDALTRTITMRTEDVPGMALPPIRFDQPAGLGVYPKPPAVQTSMTRGAFRGERTETVTYVCERPGAYTLPALVIVWWDVDAEQLKTVELPAVSLTVAANPLLEADSEPAQARRPDSFPWWTVSVIVFLGVAAMFWTFRARLVALLAQWQRQRAESEAAYFQRVESACRSNDPVAALNAVLAWLDRITAHAQSATIAGFVNTHRDVELTHELDALQRAVLRHDESWSGQRLLDLLMKSRRRRSHSKTGYPEVGLPTLNP